MSEIYKTLKQELLFFIQLFSLPPIKLMYTHYLANGALTTWDCIQAYFLEFSIFAPLLL